MLKLYTYHRSTAAYRVRIALNLKGLDHQLIPIDLVKNGGENFTTDYLNKNSSGLVPTLAVNSEDEFNTEDSCEYLGQSMAILEYLEEMYPKMPLLPHDTLARAQVRSIAQDISCDIHPLNNLRVLKYLTSSLNISEDDKLEWYRHWVAIGFSALEQKLSKSNTTGLFCYGDRATFADCCLVPQVYNAERFSCEMYHYPTIQRINKHCKTLTAFIDASPCAQTATN